VLRALSLCTCCRHYPGAAAGRHPRSSHPAVTAFPDNVVGSACTSSFSRFAQRSLALRPAHSRCHLYVTRYTEGFSHFVTSMTAPVASGWSAAFARRTREADIADPDGMSRFGGQRTFADPDGRRTLDAYTRDQAIDADDLPGAPDQTGSEESDITGAAADVKNTHAIPNAGFGQELQGDGVDELRLTAQSLQLSIRMAENIGVRSAIGFDHVSIPERAPAFRGPMLLPRSATGKLDKRFSMLQTVVQAATSGRPTRVPSAPTSARILCVKVGSSISEASAMAMRSMLGSSVATRSLTR
jgi:hypothetical protein